MSKGKLYLFVPMSGLGYLFPSIKLAHILQSRGHRVLFVSAIEHSITLRTFGIEHLAIRNNRVPFLDITSWFQPSSALDEYRIFDPIVRKYRPDVIVTSPLALICFILSEEHQIPIINIGFSEYLYPGLNNTDKEKAWRINSVTEFYNGYRNVLGLPPVACNCTGSPLIGQKYLLRNVPELSEHVSLPPQVKHVGALYFEPAYKNIPLQKAIAASKNKGRSVAYIQIGRLFGNNELWEKLINVLEVLPMNFVVDTGRSDYFSESENHVPDNFYLSPFIPLGAISTQVEFVICSGQSTTVTSAILHGKQILSIPHSADSIEFTKKLEAKRLAFAIYDAKAITHQIITEHFNNLQQDQLLPAILKYQKLFSEITDEMIYHTINE